MHVWRKTVRTSNSAALIDTLATLVDPERLVVIEPPHGRSARVEVYAGLAQDIIPLLNRFGGSVSEVRPEQWQPSPVTARGKPLGVGGRLLVTSREEELALLRLAHPTQQVLCIPAAMAFGTGEHATTSMCLRLLLDVARQRRAERWGLLDLGTGSGILALTGLAFGATSSYGVDNDPHAVRTAKENAALNGLLGLKIRFSRADLPTWPRRPTRTWPVVTANLFSELLIRLMPEIIVPSVAVGGDVILSGVLATQADEVLAATASDLELITTKRRGRWRAFHLRKPFTPVSPPRSAGTKAPAR